MTTQLREDEYLAARLEEQIGWYDEKSIKAQRNFKRVRMVELTAAALVPFLAGIATTTTLPMIQWAIAVLGVVVVVAASMVGLFDWQENWISYRSTAEALKHEKWVYLSRVSPYDGDAPFALLVERVEGLVSREHTKWQESHSQKKGASNG
jgi:hypothetical protein